MTTEDTSFQAALPDSVASVDVYALDGPDTYENGTSEFITPGEDSETGENVASEYGGTFQSPLTESDDGYASSISYDYSEEEDSDADEYAEDVEDARVRELLRDAFIRFPKGVELFKSSRPSKHEWKLNWPKEDETAKSAWVHVYGFYDGLLNSGGYGVIVRNMAAQPIAASVYYTLWGVAYLVTVLEGIDAGLKLALKHGCSSPRVICNSGVAVRLLRRISSGCDHIPERKVDEVCEICTKNMVPGMTDGYFKCVVPLIETLQGKLDFSSFTRQSRNWNMAAYYLAKQAKRTLWTYGWGYKDYKADIKPEDFSDDLLDILWKDANSTAYYNVDAMDKICSTANES